MPAEEAPDRMKQTRRGTPAALRPLHRRLGEHQQLLIGGEASVRRTLAFRAGLVLLLFVAVVLMYWLAPRRAA